MFPDHQPFIALLVDLDPHQVALLQPALLPHYDIHAVATLDESPRWLVELPNIVLLELEQMDGDAPLHS